jgi:hypothetical protein
MLKINKINFETKNIEYLDAYGRFKKYRPYQVGNRAHFDALPINYWTLSLFVNANAVGITDPDFQKVYTKLKEQYNLMSSLKPHSLTQVDQIESLAKNIHINEFCDNTLYPYQKVDANLCAALNSFANFNCMRSGKTMTTCAALDLRRQKELLKEQQTQKVILSIVQSTSRQWKRTLATVCPSYKVFDVSQMSDRKLRWKTWHDWAEFDGFAIMISNRDKLKIDIGFSPSVKNPIIDKKLIMGLHYGVITDEFHFCKGTETAQSKAHFFLAKHADFVWGLTGTKMSNNGSDLYGILKYLKPRVYTSKGIFQHRFLIEDKQYFNGRTFSQWKRMNPDTQPELSGILYMLSVERQESEVLHWVPKIQTPEPTLLQMTPKQEKMYTTMLHDMEMEINDEFISMPNAVSLRSKLLQIGSAPQSVDTKMVDLGNKEKWLVQWFQDNLPNGAVPVIFGRFTNKVLRPMVDRLNNLKHPTEKRNLHVGMIDGQTDDKSLIAEEFQNGKYDALVCNIKSGGTGLTLDRGDTAIFLEREDNLADNIQAEKRIMHTRKDDLRIKQIINILSVTPSVVSIDLVQWGQQHQKMNWVQEMYPDNMSRHLIEFEKRFGVKTV